MRARNHSRPSGPVNALSVDVEDWYQVSDFEDVVRHQEWGLYENRVLENTVRVLDLFAEFGVRATFFVLTWNALRCPEIPRMIAAAGHEVAAHGHRHRLIYEQTPAEFRDDIRRSKTLLEDLTGRSVDGYRAPSFSLTRRSLWAARMLLREGFRYDSSIFPVRDRLYGIPDAQRFPFELCREGDRALIEFPMSTARLFGRNLPLGGGAYLRVLPYRYMRWGIRQVNTAGHPAIVYFHPWELDPGQPRLRSKGKRGHSVHYLNLRGTGHKVRRLLGDFRFAPVGEVLGITAAGRGPGEVSAAGEPASCGAASAEVSAEGRAR